MSIDCSLNHDQRGDKGFLLAAVDQFGTAGPGGSQLKVLKAHTDVGNSGLLVFLEEVLRKVAGG